MGHIRDDGSMVAYSEVLTPQGLSPKEQYQRALDDLGLAAPSPSLRAEPSPSDTEDRQRSSTVLLAIAAIVVLGALALFLIGRRRGSNTA